MFLIYSLILLCVHTVSANIFHLDIHHDYNSRNAETGHNFHLKIYPKTTLSVSSDIIGKLKSIYQNEKLTPKPRKHQCELNFGSIYGTQIQKLLCIAKMTDDKKSLERQRLDKKKNVKHDYGSKKKITQVISKDYIDLKDLYKEDFDDSISEDFSDMNDMVRSKAERTLPVDYFEYLFGEKLSSRKPKTVKNTYKNSGKINTRKFNFNKNRKSTLGRRRKPKSKLLRNPKRFEVVRGDHYSINEVPIRKPKKMKNKDFYDSEEISKPKNMKGYQELYASEEIKKPKKMKKNKNFYDLEELSKPKNLKKNQDVYDSREIRKPKRVKKFKDYYDSNKIRKPKNLKNSQHFYDSEEIGKPKNVIKFKDYYDSEDITKPKMKKKYKDYYDSNNIWKHKKQNKDYFDSEEINTSDEEPQNKKKNKVFYLQGNKMIEAEDGRRRLPHFLPKRYHWKPEEIHELGYYWFNGPRGKYPDPMPLKR